LQKLEKQKKREEQEQKKKEEESRKYKEVLEKYKDLFGNRPLVEVAPVNESERRQYVRVEEVNESCVDKKVWLRVRVQTSRSTGKLCFLLLRQRVASIQGIVEANNQIPKEMVKFAASIPRESVVDVEGIVKKAMTIVESATQQTVELSVTRLYVVSPAINLPIQFEDVSRPLPLILAQEEAVAAIEKQEEDVRNQIEALKNPENQTENKDEKIAALQRRLEDLAKEKNEKQKFVIVGQNARLDNRVIDLRTAANQAIFKIQSGVCQLFRQALLAKGFIEIHTPKLISAKSEGGANVFEVIYFKRSAYLAQSPQLYKQMAIVADFERVFEIGPVFRAEDANTPRHLTEFVGLDLEMVIHQHYHEVLDVIEDMFITIFDGLNRDYRHELQIVSQQFPYEPLVYKKFRLTFPEAVRLLREAGMEIGDFDDFSTPHEKMLGKIVKEKFGTDFFVVDKFPSAVRPFYTMLDAADPRYSNSYDFFMRGQEIVSGAQRIHDPQLLEQRAQHFNVDFEKIKSYLECFKFGAPPHGGCGVGLERVVLFFLNLDNIRRTSMFPRDPVRLTP
jgi:nondiscriminating aspartyl-tRNA synthetase